MESGYGDHQSTRPPARLMADRFLILSIIQRLLRAFCTPQSPARQLL